MDTPSSVIGQCMWTRKQGEEAQTREGTSHTARTHRLSTDTHALTSSSGEELWEWGLQTATDCNRDDLRRATQQQQHGHSQSHQLVSSVKSQTGGRAGLRRWCTGVGTWLWWPQDSVMASPRHYGHSARDIANVMQRLQGRCKMLTHTAHTLVCSVLEVTWFSAWHSKTLALNVNVNVKLLWSSF